MRRLWYQVIGIFVLSCSISASHSYAETSKTSNNQKIRLRITHEPSSLDWATQSVSPTIINNVMEGLYAMTSSGKITPVQAIRLPKHMGNGKFTIRIKPGLKWSDGSMILAEDYTYSWNRLLKTNSRFAPLLADIEEFKAVGYQWIEIKMKRHRKLNPKILTHWALFPIQKKSVEENPTSAFELKKMIVNGPYLITDYSAGETLTLKPNTKHRSPGKLTAIEAVIVKDDTQAYTLYQNGKLDFITDLSLINPSDLKNRDDLHQAESTTLVYLGINTNHPFLKNPEVRKSFSWAIPRKELLELAETEGTIAQSILPKQFHSKPRFFEKKPSKSTLHRFEESTAQPITLTFIDTDKNKKLATFIQTTFQEKLGFPITLQAVTKEEFANTQQTYDLFLGTFQPPIVDKPYFYHMLSSEFPLNLGKWHNTQYDHALKKNNWYKAQDLLNRSVPIVPLYFKKQQYLMNPNVKDFVFNPITALYLRNASL